MNLLLLQNSLLVSTLGTLFAVILGFFAALCIAGLDSRWRRGVQILAIVALMLPPFLVTNCWLHFLGHTGVWRDWAPLNIFSLAGTTWILGLMLWPITAFLVGAAWQRMDPAFLEADPRLVGFTLIRILLIPQCGAAIAQAAVLTFVLVLMNFSVPAILQVKVFPAEVWVGFNTTFDYAGVLKTSWPLVLLPLLLLLLMRGQKIIWPAAKNCISPVTMRRQLGIGVYTVSGFVTMIAVFCSALLPLTQIVFAKQTWTDFLPAITAGQGAITHSVVFSVASATVVISVACLVWRCRLFMVSWLGFLVPGVLLGIGLIWIFNRAPVIAFYQSVGIVILAFALRYFAPAFSFVRHALATSDRRLIDAAVMEGATRRQVFWRVQFPQILPGVAVAWYLAYLFCLWDVETLVLIVPPGRETLSLRIFNLLHYGHNSQVNALCLVLLLVAVAPMLLAISIRRTIKSGHMAGVVLGALFLTGCSASGGKNADGGFSIESKFFSHVEIIGSRGTGAGQFNKPRSLSLDREDNLFVVDMTGRVQKFSPEGEFISSWQMPQTDLGRPKGMGLDGSGNVVVIEPHYSRVNHFAPNGTLQNQWGVHGTNNGQLAFPRAIAVNSRGEMYVSEYTIVDRVQRFSASGDFTGAFGRSGSGEGEFNRAEGVAVGLNDQILVADSCNHRIQIFTGDGKFQRSYGKAGAGAGELSYPYDLRVDSDGFQFICEFGNSRVQVFNSKDEPVEILGGAGAAPGQFANPWSLAFDSKENLYVADSQNHRVQKFVRK